MKQNKFIGIGLVLVFGLLMSSIPTNAEEYQLSNNYVSFSISDTTGALTGGWNKVTGEKYIGDCIDRYDLESETEHKGSNESKDSVISHSIEKVSDIDKLTLKCESKELGLSIIKIYTLEKNDNKIIKEVTFSGGEGFLFKYECGIGLEQSFREGGYYHKLVFHSEARPLYYAEYVPAEIGVDRANVLQVSFINLVKGYGVGHYRYKINDRYLFPFSGMEGRERIYYNPSGWRIPIFKDFMRKDYSPTIQTVYTIFKGDQVAFHREYMRLPKFKEIDCTKSSPDWVKNIKLMYDWDQSRIDKVLEETTKFANILSRGYPGYILNIGWEYYPWYGDFSSTDEEVKEQPKIVKGGHTLVLPSTIKKAIERFHQGGSWIKCGQYTCPTLIEFGSLVYKYHPEWAMTKKDGKPIEVSGGYSPATARIFTRSSTKYYIDQLSNMMKNFNLDFMYIDGGGAAPGEPDWKRKIVCQDYEGYDVWKEALDIVRKSGGAMHHNMPFGLYSDSGFWESEWQGNYDDDWRIVADRLFFTKLYQQNSRPVAIVSRATNPHTRQILINYWIGLGYLPMLERDPSWLLPFTPYINASFELRNTKIIDADVSPCWWKEDTEIEAYTLEQGPAKLIVLINHGFKKENVTVSVNRDGMGLRPNKKTMSWLIAPKDSRNVDFSKVTWDSPIDHLVDNSFIRVEDNLSEKVKYTLELEPEVVRLIMITQSPGLIYSINGERTQCLLPKVTNNIEIRGSFDPEKKACSLTVDSKEKEIELLILFPKDWGGVKSVTYRDWGMGTIVQGGGGPLEYNEMDIGGERFLKVKVIAPKGKYEIDVSA